MPLEPLRIDGISKMNKKNHPVQPSSFGTEAGRALEREAVVTADIAVHVEQEIGYP